MAMLQILCRLPKQSKSFQGVCLQTVFIEVSCIFSCDGKSSCTITDYENTYEDPCYTPQLKKMTVEYVCVKGDN